LSFTLRKVAGTAVLAVAASGLTLPLAPVAHAVGSPVETEYFISDTDGDFSYELWKRTTPDGAAVKVAGDATHDVDSLSFSRDGSRLSYLQTTYSSSGDPVSTQVVVRDVGGSSRLVRVVSSVLETTSENAAPSLSPDGSTIVWTNLSASGASLYKSSVATGSGTLLKAGYFDGVFLDGSTLLARSATVAGWASVTLSGTATANSGVDANAFDLSVSEDGTRLAWAQDTSTSSVSTSDIETATLAVSGGVATIGAPALVAAGLANEAPSFSVDGSKLYFVKWDGDQGSGDIYSAPVVADGANPPAVTTSTAGDDYDVAIGTTDDGTAPGAATPLPALLSSTTVTLTWALPADADLSGVQVKCMDNPNTVTRNVFVPAPLTSYVNTVVGTSNQMCSYTAIDRSGNLAPESSRGFVAMKPAPAVPDPTSKATTKASFPVTFSATYGSNAKYYVDYLPAGTTTWRHWITGATGNIRQFGLPATTNVLATTSTAGGSYTFRIKMVDIYGNATAYVTSARAVVPFDQTKATLSGGTNVSASAAYLGTYRKLSKTTDYAKVSLVGSRLQVVGWKCTSCGVFAIYDGSSLVGTIDTRASSTITRTVLFTRTYSSVGTHTFTIRPKATSGRPYVLLDGFAMRR